MCTPPVTDKQFYWLLIRLFICLFQFCFFCIIRLLSFPLCLGVTIKVALFNQIILFGWISSIIFSSRQVQVHVFTGFRIMWCFCNMGRVRLGSAESYDIKIVCSKSARILLIPIFNKATVALDKLTVQSLMFLVCTSHFVHYVFPYAIFLPVCWISQVEHLWFYVLFISFPGMGH